MKQPTSFLSVQGKPPQRQNLRICSVSGPPLANLHEQPKFADVMYQYRERTIWITTNTLNTRKLTKSEFESIVFGIFDKMKILISSVSPSIERNLVTYKITFVCNDEKMEQLLKEIQENKYLKAGV